MYIFLKTIHPSNCKALLPLTRPCALSMEAAGKNVLAQAAERATQAQVAHRTVAQWGAIPEQIVHLAATNQCDLIVMGTRHLTGEKRLMTGRICNTVIATAPCPVLVVPLVQ